MKNVYWDIYDEFMRHIRNNQIKSLHSSLLNVDSYMTSKIASIRPEPVFLMWIGGQYLGCSTFALVDVHIIILVTDNVTLVCTIPEALFIRVRLIRTY